ncbi:hypothetical protein [Streptomyces sp. NPDC059389]|uniref:hypothetical protein n=1 Tax=Streptomyces sp. NPDC059389 TaxID=3346818 RepID=UPI0036D196F5
MTDYSLLSQGDFLNALKQGTDGLWPVDAAVWLLERHGKWLADERLRRYVIGGVDESGELWVGLKIQSLGEAIVSGEFGEVDEDLAVLQIAMSWYGVWPISLRYACDMLSDVNIDLVRGAFRLACGYSAT